MKEVIVDRMSIEIRMPQFTDMDASSWGVIEHWYVQEHEIVHSDQNLVDLAIPRLGVVNIVTPTLDQPYLVTRRCPLGTTVYKDDLLLVLEPVGGP